MFNQEGDLLRLLEDIQRKTDELVGLVMRNDLYIQYVTFREPMHGFTVPPPEGVMRLMVDSASGLALMSRLRQQEIDKIYRYTRHYGLISEGELSFDDLMRQVERAQHLGHAYVTDKPTPGLSTIAMPLEESLLGIPLAVGVGGFSERIDNAKQVIVEVMNDCIANFRARRQQTKGIADEHAVGGHSDDALGAGNAQAD